MIPADVTIIFWDLKTEQPVMYRGPTFEESIPAEQHYLPCVDVKAKQPNHRIGCYYPESGWVTLKPQDLPKPFCATLLLLGIPL